MLLFCHPKNYYLVHRPGMGPQSEPGRHHPIQDPGTGFSFHNRMRRWCFIVLLLLPGVSVHTNDNPVGLLNADNKLFVITLDGLRWQEVFTGADPRLLTNPAYNADTTKSKRRFWAPTAAERRRKLMPFFWSIVAGEGVLYGNRSLGSRMNVANPYALSYPGYNELLTGRVDLSLFGNGKATNPNLSVLDFLNATATYNGKVAAFTSWDAFSYILNKDQSKIYLNSTEPLPGSEKPAKKSLLPAMKHGFDEQKPTRSDELTFSLCRAYIEKKQPSVVLLSFGQTDEAAHGKQYDRYLEQATSADRMIGELWQFLQTLPAYAGKTTFLVTTDHGRGDGPDNWYTHGLFVNGSSQTWMGLLGRHIRAAGEVKGGGHLYQKNLKELMLRILAMR
jgi:hypothetical protein